ncbi:polysaccharide pyruvyl transferase CsaB [Thermoclostridium stercorarium subsp. stercorarium DSM 8532]|uniref:Polysaccharide pyruvyl transferase CsaB n=4 Tax=Thermoclostridium stercorarium TaxID=1510 RepID=L7VUZ5_THES1|nr:polysaccharide pyruvyl transferase CsaB [Thermoclostridium stercorarium]AGC69403.1 polysaccharide pyruvyl transferase CsaB [Thermoclostridium stercorarium subsp. stercorarium DSM 8532]AGI40361.1 CsaB [Thermoclostridium stercorarium subsp. stercorarium DSM 8532]ANW99653.1 polysaccharide pyruvyl transferase CsaB [Thermoclostridium stercorarium subsp. thermolacticum DSM 2910]ANX02279.1 polysaccharide pyruvyl transferase CsaB [Thermoclostridium stercorarium subsp. leptospartum DSM 9219]UZQ85358
MKVLHLIGGGDEGGAKSHVLSLVQQLGNHISVKLISLRPGPFAEDAKKMGIDVEVIHTGNIFKDISLVRKIIENGRYDILHTHGAKANMIGVFMKKQTKIPVVSTIHSDYRLDYLNSIWKMYTFGLINTVSLRFLDYYVAVSNNFREMLIKRGFPPQRIYTVYNGIPFDKPVDIMPPEDFAKKYGFPIQPGDIFIGILARLDPVKGHTVFLDAAAKVAKKCPQARFLIGGPGDDLRPSLEKRASRLGISDKVFFLGKVTEPYSFFNLIDINVLASYSESFPYVILEGARMKKATVSSRVGGLEDLFVQGENGYLFTPGDSDALADYLIELICDEEKRRRFGENIYKSASERFSLKAMTETQLSIYSRIMKQVKKSKSDRKKYDIAILGYYGYRNSGDDAILKSIIGQLKQKNEELSIVVLSNDPHETRTLYKVQAVHRFNPFSVPAVLSKTRLFIAGGGTLIQDGTSSRSLWYYLFVLHLAKSKGARTVLLANGLGPLTGKGNRKVAARILNRMDAITLRDSNAYDELISLNVTKPVIKITADPALILTSCDLSAGARILRKEGIPADRKLVALCVRKWKKVKNAVQILASVADRIVTDFGATPVFISMQHPDDLRFSEKVLKQMKQKGYILSQRYTVDETLSVMGNMSLVIGMRLHSLIYAANLNIPMVGLAYEQKVGSFMESINQPYVDWNENFSMDELLAKLSDVWENPDRIKRELEEIKPQLEKMVIDSVDLTLSFLPADPK